MPPDTTATHIEAHVTVTAAGQNPVELLHAATGLPKERIKFAMTQGAVWLSHGNKGSRVRRSSRKLAENDELHIYYDADILAENPPDPDLIADVDGYSVWRKPQGLRSQGSKWGDHCTVMRRAELMLEPQRPTFTVHRLDMAANGLILVAHSKKVAAALAELFSGRKIEKRYRAIVKGDFSQHAGPVKVEEPIDDKAAVSEVSLLEVSKDKQRSLVEVNIETGRKHQIRRHLAGLGHPIVGDRLYGSGAADGEDLQLTAYRLAFDCPVTDAPVVYELPDKWLPAL